MSAFDQKPPLKDDTLSSLPQQNQNAQTIDDSFLKKGRTNRHLIRKAFRLVIPALAILVLVWILLPNQLSFSKKSNNTYVEAIDSKKQEKQAQSFHDELSLKAQVKSSEEVVQLPPSVDLNTKSELAPVNEHEDDVKSSALESPGTFHFMQEKKDVEYSLATSIDQNKNERLEEKMRAYHALNKQEDSESIKTDNERFLESHKGEVEVEVLQNAIGEHVLLQGSVIRCVLLSSINSELPGFITAMVSSNVYDSINAKHLLIPKGSRLIGQYRSSVTIGQSRILVAMQRLILPDGTYISLSGTSATDPIGQSGLSANVDNHFLKMFGSAFIIGAVSLLLPKDKATISTQNLQGDGDVSAGAISGIALYEVIRELLARNRVIGPTLTVDPGTPFAFLVAKDFKMRPYRFKH